MNRSKYRRENIIGMEISWRRQRFDKVPCHFETYNLLTRLLKRNKMSIYNNKIYGCAYQLSLYQ